MTERVFDVAIVGSGPAGASLALGLARKGLETVIIDARDPAVPSPHGTTRREPAIILIKNPVPHPE